MKRSHFKKLAVTAHDKGRPLLQVLAKVYPLLSKKRLKKSIESKIIFINGKPEVFARYPLKLNDQILLDESLLTVDPKLELLFEDEVLCVYNKQVMHTCSDPMQVHRLDKETTGVYIVAKNNQAKEHLEKQFKKRVVNKTYIAMVQGAMHPLQGPIQSYIQYKKDHFGQKKGYIAKEGLSAEMSYETRSLNQKYSLLHCYPITGRTHQIRIQLAYKGCPIIGDDKYGGKDPYPFYVTHHLLHCYCLEITHPTCEKQMEFIAPIPKDFKEIIACEF